VRSRFWLGMALVLVAAAGIRVVYVLTVTRHDTHFYDAAYYQLEAASLADGNGFTDPFAALHSPPEPAGPSAEHAPLTSIILVPAALIDDTDLSALMMRFTMVLVGLGAIVVIGLLARDLGGDTVGLVAAGIAAVDPNLWMNDGLIMSESLSVLLVAAILLLTYRVLRGASWRWILGLGALCGLLALVRAELAVLTVVMAVPAVWIGTGRRSEAPTRDRVLRVGACVAVAVVFVAPWVGFNLSRFEKPTFVSTNDGLTMLAANCDPSYSGPHLGGGDVACADHRVEGDPSVANADFRTRALDYLGDHLDRWPVVVVARVARMWSVFRIPQTVGFDVGEGRPRWASYLGVGALYLLAVLAVVGAVHARRRKVAIWPLVVPIVVVTSMMLIIGGIPRYRAAAEPSIVVLAALGVGALLARRGRRGAPASTAISPEADDTRVASLGTGS
jgi:4-amino-4-deoxy-L-arabinose transferase-like glycosyltransferase